jgi:hypothetical protein
VLDGMYGIFGANNSSCYKESKSTWRQLLSGKIVILSRRRGRG